MEPEPFLATKLTLEMGISAILAFMEVVKILLTLLQMVTLLLGIPVRPSFLETKSLSVPLVDVDLRAVFVIFNMLNKQVTMHSKMHGMLKCCFNV